MKEAQTRKLERRFGSCSQKSKAKRQEEVLKALLKKAAEQKKAETFKKAVAKDVPEEKRDLVREGAERLINDLKKLCREGSLMDVLGMVTRKVREKEYFPIVLKVLIERIRKNQWDRLSIDEQILVSQTEASLGKQSN